MRLGLSPSAEKTGCSVVVREGLKRALFCTHYWKPAKRIRWNLIATSLPCCSVLDPAPRMIIIANYFLNLYSFDSIRGWRSQNVYNVFIRFFKKKIIEEILVKNKLLSVLIDAIAHNHVKKVARLLKRGVNPNECEDNLLFSPLHYAAAHSSVEVAQQKLTTGQGSELLSPNYSGF
jgi:hypothetical protein